MPRGQGGVTGTGEPRPRTCASSVSGHQRRAAARAWLCDARAGLTAWGPAIPVGKFARGPTQGAGKLAAAPAAPRTRACAARAAAKEHNATAQLLCLADGPLARVLAELMARDLARLECVCLFFGGSVAGRPSLIAATVELRLPAQRRDMPPWFAVLRPTARLSHVELRAVPLSPAAVQPGLWLRVRTDARLVQALCEPRDAAEQEGDQDGDPAAQAPLAAPQQVAQDDADPALCLAARYVGWNDKMGDTLGRCFPVLGHVDVGSWDIPVVGLRVPRGWACVAPPFGRNHECQAPCTGGWYYPLAALERV